ncbi:glycosyltransferase family 2 protein [Stenotrophomonas sp.]|uniref:glycosyltransferase family 2 protein n=1 Tax=Stenotrophomonas sp. TaxID=69392 RepID=UPI0028B03EE4|nr:glycosyltransferase family 2 protein [Stenotrophomonas sp.]
MPPRISIAVCTYNGERFLQQQLDSLLAQTLRPDEIIVRDDVSSDATAAIVAAFATRAQAMGIHVDAQVNPENLGYRRNFQEAITACSGDLIFLCDQDDVWDATKLQRFADVFQTRPELLVLHSNARLIDGEGAPLPGSLFTSLKIRRSELRGMHDGRAFEMLLRRNLMTGAAMAFRRSLLPQVLPLPAQGWVHDAWIGILAAAMGEVDSLEDCTIAYRLHENNQLGVGKARQGDRRQHRLRLLGAEQENLLALQDHLGPDAPPRVLALMRSRLTHLQVRTHLPDSLLQRIGVVGSEWLSGRYGQFSRGTLSAMVDVLGR